MEMTAEMTAARSLDFERGDAASDDSELLRRSRAEDSDAFAELVDRYKDRVVNYLSRLTGCRDRAEDYAQETFVRLYQTLHRYRDEGTLLAYLMRIGTNLVRSDQRRKSRWRHLQPLFLVTGFRGSHGPSAAPVPSPQGEALASEEQRQVVRAIAALDVLYRAPLVLREFEGLSYQEIATALDVSEGTIKSRLHRARALLKQQLAPYWKGGQPS